MERVFNTEEEEYLHSLFCEIDTNGDGRCAWLRGRLGSGGPAASDGAHGMLVGCCRELLQHANPVALAVCSCLGWKTADRSRSSWTYFDFRLLRGGFRQGLAMLGDELDGGTVGGCAWLLVGERPVVGAGAGLQLVCSVCNCRPATYCPAPGGPDWRRHGHSRLCHGAAVPRHRGGEKIQLVLVLEAVLNSRWRGALTVRTAEPAKFPTSP